LTFGASPVLANPSQQQSYNPAAQRGRGYISIAPQQGGSQQPMEAVAGMAVQPQSATPQAYSQVSGGNLDTQYALQNPQMSAGQAYFDPNNPVRQEMSAPDQNIVNPQRQTLGQPGGRYGLGMIDYGINPATGNRVTASIRPGGMMPEYDEPIGPPGTAMGGRRGSVSMVGRKGKKNDMVSPGEQESNANPYPAQTPVAGKPVESTQNPAPTRPTLSRNDPKVQEAIRIAGDPKVTGAQLDEIIPTLQAAGISMEEIKQIDAKRGAKPLTDANQQPVQRKPWGSQEDLLAIPGQIFDAASEVAVKARRRMLGLPSPTDNPSTITPSPAKPIQPSRGQLLEQKSASSSMLQQLEQADRDSSPTENDPSEQENVRTWTDRNGKTFEGSIVEGSIEAASKQPVGQQMITVKRKDGQVFNIPVSRLSDEDIAYLESVYKIKQGSAWTEEKNDWAARYKPGQKYNAKRTKLEKNQSMNPRTSGYETERRNENPEYRQRDERTPSARTSIAKKTG